MNFWLRWFAFELARPSDAGKFIALATEGVEAEDDGGEMDELYCCFSMWLFDDEVTDEDEEDDEPVDVPIVVLIAEQLL